MPSDVVISSALRSNLLTLQNTQSLIDSTQQKLATGLKVSSALDNPQNFFAAESLKNRSGDLARLLDGIGQSISAIKQANTAVDSLTTLVDQADSIVTQAQEALNDGAREAKIVGNIDVSKIEDLDSDLDGLTAGTAARIEFVVTDPEKGDLVEYTTGDSRAEVGIGATTSIGSLVQSINDLRDDNGKQVLEAKLNDAGQLEIRSLNGGDFRMNFVSNGRLDHRCKRLAFRYGSRLCRPGENPG
jgi:flagellin